MVLEEDRNGSGIQYFISEDNMLWCLQVCSQGCLTACLTSYRTAKQHPGICYSKQRTCPLMPLHTSGRQVPWKECFSKFPMTAAVRQAVWWGPLAAWKSSCKKTLPNPQKAVQKVKLAHQKTNISIDPELCMLTRKRYELLETLLRKWSSNKSRQKSSTVSSEVQL